MKSLTSHPAVLSLICIAVLLVGIQFLNLKPTSSGVSIRVKNLAGDEKMELILPEFEVSSLPKYVPCRH